MFKKLFIFVFVLVSSLSFSQITTSTVEGKIIGENLLPIINADITIIHLPTNSSVETTTNKKGRFSIDNLDVGGPYRIIIKSKEIDDYTRNNIYLNLGENQIQKDIMVNKKRIYNNESQTNAENAESVLKPS